MIPTARWAGFHSRVQKITDENFATAIPNAPKITSGKVVAQTERVPALV